MPDVASLIARFSAEGDDQIVRAAGRIDKSLDDVGTTGQRTGSRLASTFSGFGGLLLGGAIVGGIGAIGSSLLSSSADAETMRNSFNIAVGDVGKAEKKFAWIQDMAKASPFEFPELAESATMLESFGVDSMDWMTTLGDTASGMGKPINQLAEAVLDVQVGEYARLSELGIKARKEGDLLTFQYAKNGKQITQTVDATNQDVVNSTLQGIWNDKYAGAMEVQSRSFSGQLSTFKDSVALTAQGLFAPVFSSATGLLDFMNGVFADGWSAAVDASFGGTFLGGVLSGIGDFVSGGVDLLTGLWDAFGEGDRVKTILEGLPEPIRAIAEPLLTISDSLGDLWRAYRDGGTQGFFDALSEEAGTIAQEGIDLTKILITGTYERAGDLLLNIWDWVAEKITGSKGVSHQEMIQGKGGTGDIGRPIPIGEILVDGSFKLADGLADFDAWFTTAIGADRSSEQVAAARLTGQERGREAAEAYVGGFSDGWGLFNSGDSQDLVGDSLAPPDQQTLIEEWGSWASGFASGIGQALWNEADTIATGVEEWASALDQPFVAFNRKFDEVYHGIGESVSGARTTLAGYGGSIIGAVQEGWTAQSLVLQGWATNFGTWVYGKMTSTPTVLRQRGIDLISGLLEGWTFKSADVDTAATAFGGWVYGLMPDSITALAGRGSELIQGVMDGWTERSNVFSGWASGFGSWVYGLMPDSVTALTERGTQLMGSLMGGWETKSWEMATWAGNLPGWIAGYVPSFGQGLWDRGWNLMNNLFQGLESRWNDITGWLSGLNPLDWLPSWSIPFPSIGGGGNSSSGGSGGGGGGRGFGESAPRVGAGLSSSAFRFAGAAPSMAGAFAMRGPSRAAANRAGQVVYDLRGSIVGGDVVRFVDERVASGAKKMVDTGYARNRMGEAR